MIGEGRESKKDNDLFYTCSLIDYIARKTKNTSVDGTWETNFTWIFYK